MFPSHLIRHEGEVAVATGGGRVRGVGGAVQVLGQLHLNTTAAKTFATEAGEAQGIEVLKSGVHGPLRSQGLEHPST